MESHRTTAVGVVFAGPALVVAQAVMGALLRVPGARIASVLPNPENQKHDVPELVRLHQMCRDEGRALSVDFVLDAGANALAALGRQSTSLGPVLEQSRALRLRGVPVRWWVPVLPGLAHRLEALFSLARDERVDPVLVHPSFVEPVLGPYRSSLDADSERFVRDFIAYRLLGDEASTVPAVRLAFYRALLGSLNQSPTARVTDMSATVLECGGASGWVMRHENRPVWPVVVAVVETGPATSEGAPRPGRRDASLADVTGVAVEGSRALFEWATTALVRLDGRREVASDGPLPRALIIGAYGGEHIGDAAILGGVLQRIHGRFGTREAIVVSQRPDHTRHLVEMLDTPVRVTVAEYQQSTARVLLNSVDGVVFAGGPLMDLPRQLVKHLHAVSLARRSNKPFVLEGIGIGPFLRKPSEWIARRLIRMAGPITVRTSDDAHAPLMQGLHPEVGRDPAFDYLETRRDLTRLPGRDLGWLDALLEGTEGRTIVGINLRPIRPDYTTTVAAGRRAEHTRFVEARFEERLAEALRRFHTSLKRPPCFVFFPMNAIQFGLSDLRSAYRVKRLLKGDVDFRVWEGDASIDGVVALLRQVHVVIAMRFHAAIYALSQRRRVIGIDYRVGLRDKVAALLDDFGHSDAYARIDSMTSDWLYRQLSLRSEVEPS